jgi:hypothetical protein
MNRSSRSKKDGANLNTNIQNRRCTPADQVKKKQNRYQQGHIHTIGGSVMRKDFDTKREMGHTLTDTQATKQAKAKRDKHTQGGEDNIKKKHTSRPRKRETPASQQAK